MAGGYAENIDDVVDIHYATVLAALALWGFGTRDAPLRVEKHERAHLGAGGSRG
jgi:hypothetical protein